MSSYVSINPATGEKFAEHPELEDAEVAAVIERAAGGYRNWRTTSVEDRAAILQRVADLHRERADELAAVITHEMGKPVTQALGEVSVVIAIFEYYAQNAARFLQDETLEIAGGGEAVVRTEPLGVLLGVMPWNFPYYQAARFVAPNLALGNTIILKHARNCPEAALAIERVLHDAGVPSDAYVNAFLSNDQVADVIADPRVQGVSLTGSERAGAAIGEVAGRNLKRCVLELGGSDPFVVLPDADIDLAVEAGVRGRLGNAGQVCTASKRFIVADEVYDEFASKFIKAMAAVTPGNPQKQDTFLGPMSSTTAATDLSEVVRDAVDKGAQLETGGAPDAEVGTFYPATVLTGVTPQMRAYHEELFGPAAVLFRAPSIEAAIDLANDSPFGLAGSVFSEDIANAQDVAARLNTGMVWINSTSKSAPDLPFGGIKRSGIGRELARDGMTEFANRKLIRTPGA